MRIQQCQRGRDGKLTGSLSFQGCFDISDLLGKQKLRAHDGDLMACANVGGGFVWVWLTCSKTKDWACVNEDLRSQISKEKGPKRSLQPGCCSSSVVRGGHRRGSIKQRQEQGCGSWLPRAVVEPADNADAPWIMSVNFLFWGRHQGTGRPHSIIFFQTLTITLWSWWGPGTGEPW